MHGFRWIIARSLAIGINTNIQLSLCQYGRNLIRIDQKYKGGKYVPLLDQFCIF